MITKGIKMIMQLACKLHVIKVTISFMEVDVISSYGYLTESRYTMHPLSMKKIISSAHSTLLTKVQCFIIIKLQQFDEKSSLRFVLIILKYTVLFFSFCSIFLLDEI